MRKELYQIFLFLAKLILKLFERKNVIIESTILHIIFLDNIFQTKLLKL